MPSPKYTKIEITPEAYLALESETILQIKTLKRLASELILKGVSKESLDFAQRALAVNGTNKFDEKIMARAIKDIGTSSIRINETLLKTAQEKLQKEGYFIFTASNGKRYRIKTNGQLQEDGGKWWVNLCTLKPSLPMPDVIAATFSAVEINSHELFGSTQRRQTNEEVKE